jgi:hypothetical protein
MKVVSFLYIKVRENTHVEPTAIAAKLPRKSL